MFWRTTFHQDAMHQQDVAAPHPAALLQYPLLRQSSTPVCLLQYPCLLFACSNTLVAAQLDAADVAAHSPHASAGYGAASSCLCVQIMLNNPHIDWDKQAKVHYEANLFDELNPTNRLNEGQLPSLNWLPGCLQPGSAACFTCIVRLHGLWTSSRTVGLQLFGSCNLAEQMSKGNGCPVSSSQGVSCFTLYR